MEHQKYEDFEIDGQAERPPGHDNLTQAEQPHHEPPRRRRHVVRTFVAIFVLLVLGYIGLLGYNLSKISKQPFVPVPLGADNGGRTNLLILGQGDPGHAGEGLTDTVMVISLNRATNQIAEISIPRDLRVTIPGYGKGKVNSANARGGVAAAEAAVSDALGIPIHGYILTNFSGLSGIVDAVGGLDVDVKTALVDTEYPCADNQYKVCGLTIQPGLQHMDGARVLEYTRCRKGTCGNDFGRAARQQEVIGLLKAKVAQPSTLLNPLAVGRITTAVRDAVTTDIGALGLGQFGYNWWQSNQNEARRLVLSTTNGYLVSSGGSSDLLPAGGNFERIQERVQNIFSDPVRVDDVPSS